MQQCTILKPEKYSTRIISSIGQFKFPYILLTHRHLIFNLQNSGDKSGISVNEQRIRRNVITRYNLNRNKYRCSSTQVARLFIANQRMYTVHFLMYRGCHILFNNAELITRAARVKRDKDAEIYVVAIKFPHLLVEEFTLLADVTSRKNGCLLSDKERGKRIEIHRGTRTAGSTKRDAN